MKKPSCHLFPLALILGAALGGPLVQSTHAQTQRNWIYSGSGTYNWSDVSNWVGGDVPNTSIETAGFGAAGQIITGNITVNQNITGLTVGGFGTVNTSGNTGTLTITGNAITLDNNSASAASLVAANNNPIPLYEIDLNVTDTQGLTITAQQHVRLNGNITASSVTGTVSSGGGGLVFLGGNNSFSGNLTAGSYYVATNTNAFGGTGTYLFNTAKNQVGGIVTRAAGTTNFGMSINLGTFSGTGNESARNVFSSGGSGTTLNVTTSNFLNDTAGDASLLINRMFLSTPFSPTPTGLGSVMFSGSNFTISRNVQFEGAVASYMADTRLVFNTSAGTQQTWSGNIYRSSTQSREFYALNTDGPILVKAGAGTAVLSGNNNYIFQTGVSAGTLLVNGTHIASGTAGALLAGRNGFGSTTNGNYLVSEGATLGGTGRIAITSTAANSNMILVQSGGFLAPGASIGTFTLDGENVSGAGSRVLNMAAGAKFVFELDGSGGASDQLAFWNYVNGDLLVNNNEINLSLTGLDTAGTYTVELFKFFSDSGSTTAASGITSGLVLGTLSGNISSANIIYGTNSVSLQYEVVPEPSTVALLAMVVGGVLIVRLRHSRVC